MFIVRTVETDRISHLVIIHTDRLIDDLETVSYNDIPDTVSFSRLEIRMLDAFMICKAGHDTAGW